MYLASLSLATLRDALIDFRGYLFHRKAHVKIMEAWIS